MIKLDDEITKACRANNDKIKEEEDPEEGGNIEALTVMLENAGK